jgi:hypothetical protein
MADNNTVILRVQLDEGKTEDKLKELVLSIEATRKAQQALTAERKAGAVTDAEFTKRTVELETQLKAQRNEYAANQKNLELYRTATGDLANTYKGTQAQLSLAQRQYQELQGSQDNSTESTQALAKVVDDLRNKLKDTDAQQSLFVRNLGNYPKGESLAPLVQQLVRLEEVMKSGTLTAEESTKVDAQIPGFKQRIAQAGAIEGRSYEETTAFIKKYGDAIRPATQELIKLEKEQLEVAESGKEAGEQIAQIGFRYGAAKKEIQQATEALKELPEAAEETGSAIAGALGQASEAAELLGVDIGGLESGFTRAKKGIDIAKGAFGTLRTSMLAIPIFALLAAFTALVAYFTKTREGANQLETVVAKIGATFDVIIDRAGVLGKAIAQLFSGEFKAAAETARQSYRGIGDEIEREIKLAGDLSKARQQLERDEINNIDTNKRLLNQVERLKNVRDNEFNSIKARQAANEGAYKAELEREKTLTDLAQRRVDLLKAEADRRGGLDKLGNDQLREYKEAVNAVADIQEDAAGKQNELITNRYQLEQEALDKAIERRAQANALEVALLNRQLAQVQVNSDKELSLRQQLLNRGREAELNVKNLTVKQKQAIDVKYETDSLALSLDFNRRRLQAALAAQADLTSAQLSAQQAGSAEALRLQAQQIEEQRRLAIAALAANTDNSAAIAKINAAAEAQQRQTEYQQATNDLQRFLDGKRDAIELDYAKGVIQEGEYQRRLAAVAKAGTDAQAVVNADYRQNNEENQKQATQNEIEAARRHTAEVKRQEEVKQEIKEATLQSAVAATDTIITLFGEESGAGVAALAIKKTLALAEIALNLQKELAANKLAGAQIAATIPPPVGPILGTAYVIAKDALSIAAAAAGAAQILKLEQGGIADGPSHAQGGIPLYKNGRRIGVEIEGGEPVLTRKVSENRLLLSMASAINQLAGGRALGPNLPSMPHMALGGVAQPALVLDQLRGNAGDSINYERLGEATAKAIRKNPPVNRWSDFKAAESRAGFTDTVANG